MRFAFGMIAIIQLSALLSTSVGFAANVSVDVDVNHEENSQKVWVSIDAGNDGELEDGDADLFKRLVGGLIEDDPQHADQVIVKLNLPKGGSLKAALEITKYIIEMGLTTLVPETASCQSACAFIFMAGAAKPRGYDAPDANARYLQVGGQLGFHAPHANIGGGTSLNKGANYNLGLKQDSELRNLLYNKIPKELFADLQRKGPDAFISLKNVYQAMQWDVDLKGIKYQPPTKETLLNACINETRILARGKLRQAVGKSGRSLSMTGNNTVIVDKKPMVDENKIEITTDEVVSDDISFGKRRNTGKIAVRVGFDIDVDSDPDAQPRRVMCTASEEQEGWLNVYGSPVPQWHAFALGRAISSLPKGPLEELEPPFMGLLPPLKEQGSGSAPAK